MAAMSNRPRKNLTHKEWRKKELFVFLKFTECFGREATGKPRYNTHRTWKSYRKHQYRS